MTKYIGKDYNGSLPCIDPLALAELMLRLEKKRCNPAAPKPSSMTTLLRFVYKVLKLVK